MIKLFANLQGKVILDFYHPTYFKNWNSIEIIDHKLIKVDYIFKFKNVSN
jgi:hypothetical protein